MARADKLFKRLKAARLDNTLDYEMRRLATVELLIIDDLALQPLDRTSTTDFYELCVERHQRAATIVTSNRTPDEWLTMMADHDGRPAARAVRRRPARLHRTRAHHRRTLLPATPETINQLRSRWRVR